MSPRSKMLCTLILIITFSTAFCYDDDDDDIISEIVFDLLAGVMIEECGKYQTCKMFMTIVSLTILLAGLFACLITGKCQCRTLSDREIRRIGTTYAGMRLRRALG